ncbi:Serine/threonine-protein kinase haspin [Blomia tropicalis]|nr:Serine/threonine-protein kinase haspin [Blomia tropicalis]
MIRLDVSTSHSKVESNFVQLYEQYIRKDVGRTKILSNFKLKSSIAFNEALNSYDTNGFDHIGTGSYADVFRQQKQQGFIFKLIRLLPEYLLERIQTPALNRCTKYIDAFSEFQISSALSKLNNRITKDFPFFCQMFPIINQGYLTYGPLPDYFVLSPEEKSSQNSENIYSDYFLPIEQENMVIVMEDCGQPMRDVIDTAHPYVLLSIVKQIVIGFMIAETALEFEHRDLHSGNVLLQPCQQEFIIYQLHRKLIRVPSYGYRVKIIDTTFSRMRIKQKVYFTDLSHLFANFSDNMTELKMQDQCYEQMSRVVDQNWQNFYPKTNLIWIKYVIHKLLRCKALQVSHSGSGASGGGGGNRSQSTSKVKDVLNGLNRLMDKCTNSSSCFNAIVRDHSLNDCAKIIIN